MPDCGETMLVGMMGQSEQCSPWVRMACPNTRSTVHGYTACLEILAVHMMLAVTSELVTTYAGTAGSVQSKKRIKKTMQHKQPPKNLAVCCWTAGMQTNMQTGPAHTHIFGHTQAHGLNLLSKRLLSI